MVSNSRVYAIFRMTAVNQNQTMSVTFKNTVFVEKGLEIEALNFLGCNTCQYVRLYSHNTWFIKLLKYPYYCLNQNESWAWTILVLCNQLDCKNQMLHQTAPMACSVTLLHIRINVKTLHVLRWNDWLLVFSRNSNLPNLWMNSTVIRFIATQPATKQKHWWWK